MNANVIQVTQDELRQLVDEMVEEKLATLFRDPEDDLEITDELREVLIRQSERIRNGERGEPLEKVVKRLGLN